jgi:thymidylate synthase (FAD)
MFRIRMPIYLAREWFKHTVGVARNEESRRYVTYAPDCFLPEQLRRRNPDAKQGSLDVPVDDGDALRQEVHDYMERGLALYDKLLRRYVCLSSLS